MKMMQGMDGGGGKESSYEEGYDGEDQEDEEMDDYEDLMAQIKAKKAGQVTGAPTASGKPPSLSSAVPGGLVVKYAGMPPKPSPKLAISGLPGADVESDVLKELFEMCDLTVKRCIVNPDKRGGQTCSATVEL